MGDDSQVYYVSDFLQFWLAGVCAILFGLLLILDAWEAYRRWVHWVRGDALVLSILTIQLFSAIDDLRITYGSSDQIKDQVDVLLDKDQLVIDTRRLMVCVYLGYLVPGMARFGQKWSDIAVLASNVILHISSELFFVSKYIKPNESKESRWFTVYCVALSTAITLLVGILLCSVIAGKTICIINSQKIPLALSCCSSTFPNKCDNIEDHVLKCWIVARVSHPDYIMARSGFSSLAGLVVTLCVVMFAVKLSYVHLITNYNKTLSKYEKLNIGLHKTTLLLVFLFVVVGWIVICIRWFTGIFYFPRWKKDGYFEDLWTSRLVVDNDNGHSRLKLGGLIRQKQIREKELARNVLVNWTRPVRFHLTRTLGLWLQKIVVLLSKVSWYISQYALRRLRRFIMNHDDNRLLLGFVETSNECFSKYKETLQMMQMPGEKASSLWIANKWAFKQTEIRIQDGRKADSETEKLIRFLRRNNAGPAGDAPILSPEEGTPKLSSSKMKAVWFIHLMMYFYDGANCESVVDDAIDAYNEACEYMDLVVGLDSEAMSMRAAADRKLAELVKIWDEHRNIKCNQSEEESIKLLERKIKAPLKELMEKRETRTGREPPFVNDMDWMEIAAAEISPYNTAISLCKTWKDIDHSPANSGDRINNLQRLLAKVILQCIEKDQLTKAIRERCKEWAIEGKEDDIFNAAFITGKATVLFHEIGKGTKQESCAIDKSKGTKHESCSGTTVKHENEIEIVNSRPHEIEIVNSSE